MQILSGTLASVANQAPIIAQPFSTQNGLVPTTARYLKFESLTATSNNAGLNEFEVYSAFMGSPPRSIRTRPPAHTLARGGFVTFDAATLGFTSLADEIFFFFTPGRAAVLDGVKVKATHQSRRVRRASFWKR